MSNDETNYTISGDQARTPCIFLEKYWNVTIDPNVANYISNSALISTSDLANANRWSSLREAYLQIPMIITLTTPQGAGTFSPATSANSADMVVGLRNLYSTVIHSIQIDVGSNVVPICSFVNMYNAFKLIMTMSWDSISSWAHIGFYPDTAGSVSVSGSAQQSGISGTICNNNNYITFPLVSGCFNQLDTGNVGFLKRQLYTNFNPNAYLAGNTSTTISAQISSIVSATNLSSQFKSYIFNTVNQGASQTGIWQMAVNGIVYMKHLTDWCDKMPLVKSLKMDIRLQLNNTTVTFSTSANGVFSACSVSTPFNGVSPLMIASGETNAGSYTLPANTYTLNLTVGGTCGNTTQASYSGVQTSPYRSISLYTPQYTFNPVFEELWLQDEFVEIEWEDVIFQSFVNQLPAGGTITGGIICQSVANATGVLILPFYSASSNASLLPFQSPFCGDGAGPTSPFAYLSNVAVSCAGRNVVPTGPVSRLYEQYLSYVYGAKSINGGSVDALNGQLINGIDFETSYNYYWFDVSRSLPEQATVPKQYTLSCNNGCQKALDLYCFITYKKRYSFNKITMAQVAV